MLTSLLLAIITARGGSVVKQTTPVATEQEKSIPEDTTGPIQGGQPLQPADQGAPAEPATPSK